MSAKVCNKAVGHGQEPAIAGIIDIEEFGIDRDVILLKMEIGDFWKSVSPCNEKSPSRQPVSFLLEDLFIEVGLCWILPFKTDAKQVIRATV